MKIKAKKWWMNQKTGQIAITKGKEYEVVSRDVIVIGDHRKKFPIDYEVMEDFFEIIEE